MIEQRPQILVPRPHEHDGGECRHVGPGQRHQHLEEEADRAGAVHLRRLGQLVRHGQEELAVEEGAGRGRDQRQDQAGIAVEQVPFRQVDRQAGDVDHRLERPQRIGGDRIGRHDAHFERQHQRDEDQPEHQHAQPVVEIDDREGRQRRERDLAGGDAAGDDQRVQHDAVEIALLPGRRHVLEEMAARQQRHRHLVDGVEVVAGRDEDDPQRDQPARPG